MKKQNCCQRTPNILTSITNEYVFKGVVASTYFNFDRPHSECTGFTQTHINAVLNDQEIK